MNLISKVRQNSLFQFVWGGFSDKIGISLALILLLVVSSFLHERFLTVTNLLNVLRQISIVGILAIGQTYVILSQGIDISVGSLLAVTVVLIAGFLNSFSIATALALGVLAAVIGGLINGIIVAYGKVPSFIVTLGMLSFARGIAYLYTGGTPIPIVNEAVFVLGNDYLWGIPIPVIIFMGMLVLFSFILIRTPFGRSIYAIGGNENAARLAGVPVDRFKVAVFTVSGLSAGMAGVLYASQLGVGTPIAGRGFGLDAIAAVVVGGTDLFGGRGSLYRTFLGTVIIGVLANILNLTAVSPFIQRLFKGALIVVAVLLMSHSTSSDSMN